MVKKKSIIYASKTIASLCTECDTLLKNQLGRLIVLYKDSHPKFYDAYKKARKIVSLGIRYNAQLSTNIKQAA